MPSGYRRGQETPTERGDFWDGARNGLISAALNHAAHQLTKIVGKLLETKDGSDEVLVVDNEDIESFRNFLKEMTEIDTTDPQAVKEIALKYSGNQWFSLYSELSQKNNLGGGAYIAGYEEAYQRGTKFLARFNSFNLSQDGKGSVGGLYSMGANAGYYDYLQGNVSLVHPQIMYRANNPVYTMRTLNLLFK